MKYAPLIHSRTYHCDFNAKFSVRPDDFTDEDAREIHKTILASTSEIDFLKGERRVVFSYKNHVVAGLVSTFEYLKGNESSDEADKLLLDKFNRKTYGFVGIVFKDSEGIKCPQIDKSFLWGLLKEYMLDVWERTTSFPQTVSYKENEFENVGISNSLSKKLLCGINVGESSNVNDVELFYYYLSEALKDTSDSKISFCSNLESKNAILRKRFMNVTTSNYVMNLLEKADKEAQEIENLGKKKQTQHQDDRNMNIEKSPRKNGIPMKLALGITVIVIIAIIAMLK